MPFPNFLSQTKRSFQFDKIFWVALNAIEIVACPKIWNASEHVEGQDKIELSLYIYCSGPKTEFVELDTHETLEPYNFLH